jgi:hypothetical protein
MEVGRQILSWPEGMNAMVTLQSIVKQGRSTSVKRNISSKFHVKNITVFLLDPVEHIVAGITGPLITCILS